MQTRRLTRLMRAQLFLMLPSPEQIVLGKLPVAHLEVAVPRHWRLLYFLVVVVVFPYVLEGEGVQCVTHVGYRRRMAEGSLYAPAPGEMVAIDGNHLLHPVMTLVGQNVEAARLVWGARISSCERCYGEDQTFDWIESVVVDSIEILKAHRAVDSSGILFGVCLEEL